MGAVERLDTRSAIAYADATHRTPGTNDQIRALGALKHAQAHVLNGDADAAARSLTDVRELLLDTDPVQAPWGDLVSQEVTHADVLADDARCWSWLRPHKAIPRFEDVLRSWPPTRTRDQGVVRARLGLACARAGEPERAAAEGMTAIGIAESTRSTVTVRELMRLDRQFAAYELPAVAELREAVAAL
jgi:hypothetical protein